MKLPRDISGEELAKRLEKFDYKVSRQTGSHVRLSTELKGEHHITIPQHRALSIGTLSAILRDIAEHLEIDKTELLESLFK